MLSAGEPAMKRHSDGFVGMDVPKLGNAIAVAPRSRDQNVRFVEEVDASPRRYARWSSV